MSLLIKNWSLAGWKELLMWAKIGANNAMIGEFTEVEEIPPHGRLIDADALIRDNGIREIPEYHEVVLAAPTVIEAEEE